MRAISRRDTATVTAPGRIPLIWLATNSCSAHIINFMNSSRPSLREVLSRDFDLLYDSFVMAAEGERATRVWYGPEVQRGDFVLVVEGTVPTAHGGRTTVVGKVGGRDVTALELVRHLGARARWIIAVGTCAAFGGPYAAAPNPTGSRSLREILGRRVINVPGCPVSPGWIHDTLQRLRLGERIKLDPMGRPLFIYGTTIHSLCERLEMYEDGVFARRLGDEGCMYLLGCKGPDTRADCPSRQWLDEKSGWPVGVNTPCIGCTAPEFPDGMSPFFTHTTDLHAGRVRVNLGDVGRYTAILTAGAIGAHLAGQIVTGRLQSALLRPLGAGIRGAVARWSRR